MKNNILEKIIKNNLERDSRILSPYACSNVQGMRKFPEREKIRDEQNIRQAFFHDTDKIIHSRSYSRYIDKTQVFYLFENDHITHRVLHVQFVSKIGRVIGRCLRLNEDLIEAISLGHDLGHVPYGHEGEKILNSICTIEKIGCFMHNVQSVRFLNEIENNGEGLNLTLQVLDGILTHNGEIVEKEYKPHYGKDWAVFEKEYEKCLHDENYNKKIYPMTLEGCVARISDVIAYIGRDIEDAIRVNLIKKAQVPGEIKKVLGSSNDKIINTLVMDLIDNSYEKNYLSFSENIFKALKDLLEFNKNYIYDNIKIKDQNDKIEHMFKHLYRVYREHIEKNDRSSPIVNRFLHYKNEAYLKNNSPSRIVVDFIAGMTDDYFNNQYRRLFIPQRYGYALEE